MSASLDYEERRYSWLHSPVGAVLFATVPGLVLGTILAGLASLMLGDGRIVRAPITILMGDHRDDFVWRMQVYTLCCVACTSPFVCLATNRTRWLGWPLALSVTGLMQLAFATLIEPLVSSDPADAPNGLAAAWSFGSYFAGLGAIIALPRKGPRRLVRGARLRDEPRRPRRNVLRHAIVKQQVMFAGVLLHAEAETRHIACLGTTGAGKTTAIRSLIRTAISRGDRMIVADPGGGDGLARHLTANDVVLNPFDARSVRWDPLLEIEDESDHDTLAEALIPATGSVHDETWEADARAVLAAVVRSFRDGEGDATTLSNVLSSGSAELLGELCSGTPAARVFEAGNERFRGSVLAKLRPATKVLQLFDNLDAKPFSVREWLRSEKGSLWLPYRVDQLTTLRSAIGCWLSLAITEALSLTPDRERRLWFIADELDMLSRVPALENGLTNGRKFGACFVLGLQSIAQLRRTYGELAAHTIVENCGNKLILRCDGSEPGGTAHYASALIGEREVAYQDVTHGQNSGGSSYSTTVRHKTERAVLASQVAGLADRTGYLKLATDPGWELVEFPYVDEPQVAEPFVGPNRRAR